MNSHRHILPAVMGFLFLAMEALGSAGAAWSAQDALNMDKSFLQKAAEGQQAEIALGQLAKQKASDEQVKAFGERMIHDHQKASQEVQQLASKEGYQIPTELSQKHQEKQHEFSRLSGKEFDRAYMSYMLKDHSKDVHEFEQSAQVLKDPQIKAWAAGTLPVLKEHLEKAKTVASAIDSHP